LGAIFAYIKMRINKLKCCEWTGVLEEAPRNGERGPFKTPNLRKAESEQRYREPQLFWCVSRLTTSFGASPPQKRNYSASFAVTSGAPYQRACFCLAFR
jgi:hypothetical protein